MPAPNRGGFLPLLRGQHRIQGAAGSADDGVQLGLDPSANRSQLTTLPIHDGIDLLSLLERKPYLLGKTIAERVVPGRTAWSVLEPRPPELSRQKNQPIQRHSAETAGQQREQQHQRRDPSGPRPARGGARDRHRLTASSKIHSPSWGAIRWAAIWLPLD